MDKEKEYMELMKEMEFCRKLVERSEIFQELLYQLEDNAAVKDNLSCALGSHKKMLMLVYDLCSIQYSWPSRFRLSLALLLKNSLKDLIECVEVCGPTANPLECRIMNDLGCIITLVNKRGRQVDKPTLFFLPYPDHVFLEQMLEANWHPSQLNQIIVLGGSIRNMGDVIISQILEQEEVMDASEQKHKVRRLMAIKEHMEEFNLCREIDGVLDDEILREDNLQQDSIEDSQSEMSVGVNEKENLCNIFSLHFFKVNDEIDIEAMVPSNSLEWKMKSYISPKSLVNRYNIPTTTCMEQKDVVEASRLKDEIETTMEEIRESKLYTKLSNYLKNDPEIRSNVSRMLGTHEHIQMVIYGVGSIEISYTSQYQLALALLLMKDSCFPIGEIEVFDPAMSSADIKACSDLGCRVLLINEQCRRTVEKPTLFYIPGLLTHLVGNLIKVNFHPCRLNQMILLQYDQMKSPGETTGKSVTLKDERMMYDSIITKYCSKTVCLREFSNATSCLWELMFSFFDLDPSLDMKAFIPCVSMKDLLYHDYIYDMWDSEYFLYDRVAYRRTWNARYILEPFSDEKLLTLHSSDDDCYDDIDRSKYWSLLFDNERLPARYRCTWHQPHRGWIKLNYSGRSHGKEGPAGYGGTFHDEHRKVLLSYAGPLENADFIMASLEGLRQGLRCLTKLPHIPKLIIEGDALSIARWMNEAFTPPERVAEGFEEIYRLIEPVERVVVHVDNEANQMAIGLANKGAKLERLCVWQQQDDPGAVTQELPGPN